MGLGPPNYLSWSNNVLKKNCPICLVVIENVLFLKFIFYGKMSSHIFLKFWIIYVFKHFINSIEIFLLTMVDNLVTYIDNENCKDFTMEDGERLI